MKFITIAIILVMLAFFVQYVKDKREHRWCAINNICQTEK